MCLELCMQQKPQRKQNRSLQGNRDRHQPTTSLDKSVRDGIGILALTNIISVAQSLWLSWVAQYPQNSGWVSDIPVLVNLWCIQVTLSFLDIRDITSGGTRVSGARGHRSFWRLLPLHSPPLSFPHIPSPPLPLAAKPLEVGPLKPS